MKARLDAIPDVPAVLANVDFPPLLSVLMSLAAFAASRILPATAAEYYVDDFGVEEYLLRFRTFVLTSQGLSIGSYLGDEEDEVHEEILEFLRG